jgi:hypothetical protein
MESRTSLCTIANYEVPRHKMFIGTAVADLNGKSKKLWSSRARQ